MTERTNPDEGTAPGTYYVTNDGGEDDRNLTAADACDIIAGAIVDDYQNNRWGAIYDHNDRQIPVMISVTFSNPADALTDDQIQALRDEAAEAGDLEQVAICDRALDLDTEARAECARVIDDARAMDDLTGDFLGT